MNAKDRLKELAACPAAINWAGSEYTMEELWYQCNRGDWLVWLAVRVGVDLRLLTGAVIAISGAALPKDTKDRLSMRLDPQNVWEEWSSNWQAAVHISGSLEKAASVYEGVHSAKDQLDELWTMAEAVRKWVPWSLVEKALSGPIKEVYEQR